MTKLLPRFVVLFVAITATVSTLILPTMAGADVADEAVGQGAVHDGHPRVQSRLIADVDQVTPGDTFRIGIAFDMDTDWHIYWQNPGDAGLPTDVSWEGEGLEFGPLMWAAPMVFEEADGQIDSFGYEQEVVLFSEVEVDEEAAGELEVGAAVGYLACKDACVEGQSELSRTISVGDQTRMADEADVELFDAAVDRVPRGADSVGLEATFHYETEPLDPDQPFEVAIEIVECDQPGDECRRPELEYDKFEYAFYSDSHSAVDVETTGVADHPDVADGVVLKLKAHWNGNDDPHHDELISGVVEFELADRSVLPVHLHDELSIADDPEAVQQVGFPAFVELIDWESVDASSTGNDGPVGGDTNILLILLMAFFGGMILNLMPCVFPVLALKVSSFAEMAHEDRSGVMAHGMAYTVGIVGSMLVLATVVIGLRVFGTEVGWGFQFQQPHFLAALLVILVLFALNLFGVFEVTVGSDGLHEKTEEASGLRKSAWKGVLAVVLATPCSAPFLGTAVGFALASSAPVIIAVFAMLGLGLAAPMVVLMLMPGWAKLLPRPGVWMEHLKHFLGFALVGTAIWIVWLVGRQAGVDVMGQMLMLSGVVALAAWIWGLVQFKAWSWKKLAAVAVAAGLVGATATMVFPVEPDRGERQVQVDGDIDWQPWSEEAVDEALSQGRPVFVNFTADWCLTCQVNKENAIETEAVYEAVDRHDVVMLEADWTDTDEQIRQKLAEHNRAAIPYYLVYSPDAPESPESLSEVITSNTLVDAFERAASGG